MKRYTILKVMIAMLMGMFLNNSYGQPDWELIQKKDDIYIYKRSVAGSAYKQLKVVSDFQSSLQGFIAFLKDIPSQTTYMYNCSLSRVLKEIGNDEIIFYQQLDAPWPFSNRDGIYRQQIKMDSLSGMATVKTTSLYDYISLNKKFTRVKNVSCTWYIKQKSNGTVNVEYYFYGEPGGTLPGWLINLFIAEAPYKTQKKMHELVKLAKYQQAN